MISIDTSILRDLVAASAAANTSITDAVEVLSRISAHNDWACKEKDAINEYTATNKNKIRQLQEHSASFLSAITGAATEFEEAETSISDMFSSVETLLSGILSIATPLTGAIGGAVQSGGSIFPGFEPKSSGMWEDMIKDYLPQVDFGGLGSLEAFIAGNVTEPISVCSFSDLEFGPDAP